MFSAQVIERIQQIRGASPRLNYHEKNVVLVNLLFMQQVMTASHDLLKTALYSIGRGKFENALAAYYNEHMNEEKGHAAWLARDLKSADIDVRKMTLSRKAVEMAGTQYYLIRHIHPAALLGYMAVLEGFPMSMQSVEELEAAHGKELFRTLRYHAEHDLEHRKDLFRMIDTVPEKYRQIVQDNAAQTAIYLSEARKEWQM